MQPVSRTLASLAHAAAAPTLLGPAPAVDASAVVVSTAFSRPAAGPAAGPAGAAGAAGTKLPLNSLPVRATSAAFGGVRADAAQDPPRTAVGNRGGGDDHGGSGDAASAPPPPRSSSALSDRISLIQSIDGAGAGGGPALSRTVASTFSSGLARLQASLDAKASISMADGQGAVAKALPQTGSELGVALGAANEALVRAAARAGVASTAVATGGSGNSGGGGRMGQPQFGGVLLLRSRSSPLHSL